MAILGLGRQSHDPQADQAGGHKLQRDDHNPIAASGLECQSSFGASFCSPEIIEARYTSARCHEGRAMQTRDFASIRRSQRALRPYPESYGERDYSARSGSHPAYGPATVATYGDPVTTAEKIILWIRQTKLRSNGATRYLNSVVVAQLWALAMMADSVREVWDAWAPLLSRLFGFSCIQILLTFAGMTSLDRC